MNRIDQKFEQLKKQGRKGLITFVTGGDPDAGKSIEVLSCLPDAGADLIEIGMPFSDPMADGPVIQASSQRALNAGMSLSGILEIVQKFRSRNADIPVILMGYYNPVYQYGPEKFARNAAKAGIDGVIIVDLPPEEDEELRPHLEKAGLHMIRLITPTTDAQRLPSILDGAGGFLYYVSITGVTGTASADLEKVKAHIGHIKKETDLPVVIGFGIKTPADATAAGKIADGVVVGSAIVQNICDHQNDSDLPDQISAQVKELAVLV